MEKSKALRADDFEELSYGKQVRLINPNDIKYLPINDFSIGTRGTRVGDGDWDLGLRLFEESSLIYKAYRDVFKHGKNWLDTELFSEDGHVGVTRCIALKNPSQGELNKWRAIRIGFLNYLYKAMREFGYIQNPFENFISVLIGRNGEVILNNGRHRLAAAKLLNVPVVPILIDVVHREWQDFKESILAYASRHGNRVYAQLKHVDLQRIPTRQRGRISEILAVLNPDTNTIVDLGSQWGHMCQRLEDEGYECTAVEGDLEEFSFLKKFKAIGEYKYDIHLADICDFVNTHNNFDCVLALSVFHHLAKTEQWHEKLIKLLQRLDCNEMIFQMPDVNEMASMPAYRNYSWQEFTKLIIDNSCLNSCREIGNRETRKMFHLRR